MRPCLACLRPIKGLTPGIPAICAECWPALSVMDRDRLMASEDIRVHMRAMLSMMQGNRETEEVTRAANSIERAMKKQQETLAEIRQDMLDFLAFMREYKAEEDKRRWE